MKKLMFYMVAGILLIGAACSSSITITTDYDREVDFTKYKTFGFLEWNKESKQLVNDIDRKRLEDAVAAELEARGLKRVDGIGDSMIGFHVVVETKTGTTSYTNHYGGMGYYGYGGFGYGYGYPYGGASTTTTSTYSYNVGTVIIDQYDSSSKKLVWEGVAQGEVNQDRKNREEYIKKDIQRMFAEYPVPLPEPTK
ncbi:DUF4136 domain-containing protein [bacterium SCSIO 12643]|nr:DUF4136 domain-containing protein [bacterium SCSIO 12643]